MNPFLNMAAMGPMVGSMAKMPKFDWQGLLGDAGAMMTQQAAAQPQPQQQQQGALPQAPAIPINVTDLNPLYDFTRFRFGGGAPQGPFGR